MWAKTPELDALMAAREDDPPLDWSKPLMHRNGQRCTLLETRQDGVRVVLREEENHPMCAIWQFAENGRSGYPAYDLVNAEYDA